MSDLERVLRQAGVPLGHPATVQSSPSASAVREALSGLGAASALDERTRTAVLAWLRAFKKHWPRRFDQALDGVGTTLLGQLEATPIDTERYLKLRRLSTANLARLGAPRDD